MPLAINLYGWNDPRPRLFFGNLLNGLMIGAPSRAYARGLHAVSPRLIWLARPGDVVVTPRAIDDDFKRYACSLIGCDPAAVVTLDPGADAVETLASAVHRSGLMTRLDELVQERPGLRLAAFAIDRPVRQLAEKLNVPLLFWSQLPTAELSRWIYQLNAKSGFRREAEALGLPTVPGGSCEGVDQLLVMIPSVAAETGSVIVKFDRSSNGYGHLILRDVAGERPEALRERVSSHLSSFPEQPTVFTVEALEPFVRVPSVEMVVDAAGTRLLYLCDQRCRNASFSGMITPPVGLDREIERQLVSAGESFGKRLHALGYRGVYDVDGGVTPNGRLFVTETNLRETGGTYLDFLVRRLVGDDYQTTHVWLADSRPAGPVTDFRVGRDVLRAAGLLFCPDRREGVILTADTLLIDGRWRYLVVARGVEEAAEVEAGVERVLQLPEVV